ncbi:2Fe-2S iron-sulfur cluster-binding protein [Methylovirgula ligni]|nr:2Fe-2S iron-sulfur cluster-binding protein [Methylovirgula ligni]
MSKREPFLSRILIFPIKSLDPVEPRLARVLSSGALEHDRTWALFDEAGKFVNGKRHAAVHRLRSEIDIDTRAVTLRDESERGLGSESFSIDAAPPLENWLNAYFGFPVSFGKNGDLGFPDDTDSPGPTIISVGTLAEIGRWFGLPIDEVRRRFRTNLEIDGVPPFWEDRLFSAPGTTVKFRIGDVIFEGINPCQRCVVPPRDPLTGESDDTFVRRFTELRARTLPGWSTRERFNHFYRVAINTRTHGDQGGKVLHVGDSVEILEVPAGRSTERAPHVADFWAGDLVVESTRDETATVKTFRLRHPGGADIPFRFLPGQFLTLSLDRGAEVLQRCYTIASSPSEPGFCEITVKREGLGSGLLHESLAPGSHLAVSGPLGRFTFDGENSDEIVFIAGGVGITPLMSKIRYLTGRNWQGRIDLIYSVRTPRDIIFRDELDALQRAHPALKVHLTVTAPDEGWTGARGRLSETFIRAAVPDIAHRTVHICGPTAMAAAAQQMLHHLGVEASHIEIEAFGGNANVAPTGDAVDCEVRFVKSGKEAVVSSRATLLDAALAAGVGLDYGCRAGVCGRCKIRVIAGEVTIDCDFVLTPEQKDSGLVLSCQSHPAGTVLIDA